MIIGIDHIALSAGEINRAVNSISTWGYIPKFINKQLPNSIVKRQYLTFMGKSHDICFCKPAAPGIAIELTAHGNTLTKQENPPYTVVFRGKNPGIVDKGAAFSDAENCKMLSFIFKTAVDIIALSEFRTNCYYMHESGQIPEMYSNIHCVIAESLDLDRSTEFWLSLGFSVKNDSFSGIKSRYRLLEFKSHFSPVILNLLLTTTPDRESPRKPYCLDMPGFTCVAFLTNNIARESERLKRNKIEVSEIDSIRVGGNALKICLCVSPDGGLSELIQLEKTTG